MSSDSDKVAILVKKAALAFDKLANPVLGQYGLTVSQYKILKFLYTQPLRKSRMVDIENCYSLTHPTTLGLLENLEKKGFVTRVPNPEDARSKLISLTEKADAMQDELVSLGSTFANELTVNLTEKEKQRLAQLLQKLLEK